MLNKMYKCLVVDPAWDQGKTGKRKARPNQGIDLDYKTMTPHEIESLDLYKYALDDSFIWLWATNSKSRETGKPILYHALQLLEYWHFNFYTMLTWDKKTGPCPFGPYQITTEYCLFGYKGKFSVPKESLGKMKTCFTAPVVRHSEKPDLFYENVAKYFPGPRADFFARKRHEGFDAYGDQVEG